MLKSSLAGSPKVGLLPTPLAGPISNYDSFISSVGGQVCEAACLCSFGIDVTVLVSSSNLFQVKSLYMHMRELPWDGPRPLLLNPKYINADRLLSLMSLLPLYM